LSPRASPCIFLPGAGGLAPDLSLLRTGPSDSTQFVTVGYPGWQRYVAGDFSPEVLIRELSDSIIAIVPAGPIGMIGMSLGGHFCYAIALHLRSRGREVAGICVIDSFMVASSAPSSGWVGRALAETLEPLRRGRFREFPKIVASRFWRALLRLAGPRLPGLMRRLSGTNAGVPGAAQGSLLEFELSMRLLLREVAPWVASLDRDPIALEIPAALLRTSQTSADDAAWKRRCPNIRIHEVPGSHHTLFDPGNIDGLRAAFSVATREWRRN
jgi:thioesterase domain-containing protein